MILKIRRAATFMVVGLFLSACARFAENLSDNGDKCGASLNVTVYTDKAVERKIVEIADGMAKDIAGGKLKAVKVNPYGKGLSLEGLETTEDKKAVVSFVEKNYPFLKKEDSLHAKGSLAFIPKQDEARRIKTYAAYNSLEVIRRRMEGFGVSGLFIQKRGTQNIVVRLSGTVDLERIANLIGRNARLSFHMVDDSADINEAIRGNIPSGDILLFRQTADKIPVEMLEIVPYVLKKEAFLNEANIVDAAAAQDPYGFPCVSVKFDAVGSKLLEEATAAGVGKRMAIVLDDEVYSAPIILEKISGGEASVSGNFSRAEAEDLAAVLRSGRITAPISVTAGEICGR